MSGQAQDPVVGRVVSGRYRVLQRLGEGGMGQVYLAVHEAIEKKIALKVLRPEYSTKEDIVTRFQQEAISASRIKHPNVLEVFDFGTLDNGCAFLAMEFLQGNDMADELVKLGSLETPRALRIMLQVCRALSAAHKAGVVHRDMKPDNIFLLRTDDGEEIVKIVDFGIAQLRNPDDEAKSDAKPRRRLTKTGMIFGTPEYMAPEQAAGKAADLRVDVYATGIILFEMLTGAVPFTGDSFMAVLAAHLNDPAPSMMEYRPDLQVSQQLHNIVARMLAKKPDDRFQSMAEVAAALLATPEGHNLQSGGDMPMSMMHPGSLTPPALTAGSPTSAQFRKTMPTSVVPGQSAQVGAQSASHTLEAAATASSQKPKKSNLVGIVAGVVSMAVFVGGAAFAFTFMGGDPDVTPDSVDSTAAGTTAVQPEVAATVTATAPVATAPATTVAAPTATVPAVEPTTAASSGPEVAPVGASGKVRLTVETHPVGAKVSKGGFQVCDAAPCEIDVEQGEAVELSADLNGRKGSAKVLAQQDQTVTITLKAPAKSTVPKEQKLCEVPGPGGLKIFRPCQ